MTSLTGALAHTRSLFPQVRDSDTAYLDSAATTHKPESVLRALSRASTHLYAPVHRGLYSEAESASEIYEEVRSRFASRLKFNPNEIIFTRSATESINAVAERFLIPKLSLGDWVWVTELEHHANYLPWQRACQQTGAELKVLEIDFETGAISSDQAEELADERSKMLAITAQSNVLGVMPQLEPLIEIIHAAGGTVLVDAAQCISHKLESLVRLSADFLVFSGHKIFGPTGIGVLAARYSHLETMQPWLLGGGMVDWVGEGISDSQWADIPARFEGGSPNFIGVVGLGAALEFLDQLPRGGFSEHLSRIGSYAFRSLSRNSRLRMLTPEPAASAAVLSFVHEHIHPHDLAQVCADNKVAVRAGHHCAQPLMWRLNQPACLRASASIYTTESDIDRLIDAIDQAERIFL